MLQSIKRLPARVRAELELRCARGVQHAVTSGQVRWYVTLGGYEPTSYRLDPDANWLPQGLIVDGAYGLAFSYRDDRGRLHETVALPDGDCRFELFEAVSEDELLACWDPR